ncbi:MAG: hypothetical protein ACIALR_15430 [Blastopirellula sp. JB062]
MRQSANSLLLFAICLLASTAQAGDALVGGCGAMTAHGRCCSERPCVECAPFVLTKSCEEETKHCWTTRCEQIEIPPVRFPWEKSDCCGCDPPLKKCGKVRTVNRLWKNDYKVSVPKFEWIRTCLRKCVPCSSADDTQAESDEAGPAPQPPQPPVSAGLVPPYDVLPSSYHAPQDMPVR